MKALLFGIAIPASLIVVHVSLQTGMPVLTVLEQLFDVVVKLVN
jgi:hypothetical protein